MKIIFLLLFWYIQKQLFIDDIDQMVNKIEIRKRQIEKNMLKNSKRLNQLLKVEDQITYKEIEN